MLSSVTMAIHEACWQGLFEECELFYVHSGRSANQSVPPLFLLREAEHFPSHMYWQLHEPGAASKHGELSPRPSVGALWPTLKCLRK